MSEIIERAEIAIVDTKAVSIIYSADKAGDDLLAKLAEKVASHEADISTAAGRAAIRSLAYEIATTKSTLDKLGMGMTEEWRKQTGAVNAERRVLKEKLEALQEQVRAPLTEWEQREERRVAKFEAALAEIVATGRGTAERWQELDQDAMRDRLAELEAEKSRDWEEFAQRASYALATSIDQVTAAITRRKKADDDAAELAEFRRQAEERQREAQVRAQQEREERIAAEAADTARQAAEARAAQAQREAEQAAALAQEQAEAAERRAVEAAAQADRDRLAAAEREREAVAAADRRAAEAERRATEAREQAERDRAAEAERLEQERGRAIEAERQRVADEAAAEAQARQEREANAAHKRKIDVAAASALASKIAGLKDAQAKQIVAAIAKGEVPGITIHY